MHELPLVQEKPRFHFVDGLRALAAMAVMFHHAFHRDFGFTHTTDEIFNFGRRGVQVFFVISGFVVAYSLAGLAINVRTAGNFLLRRQIRLDPAFWFCLGIAFLRLHVAAAAKPHDLVAPTAHDLLLNALYVSSLVDRNRFLGPSWTLSLEVQFYLVFVLIVWLAAAFRRARPGRTLDLAPPIVFLLGLVSVWSRSKLEEDMEAWWFTQGWNLFALGVLAYWAHERRCSARWFGALLAAVTLTGLIGGQQGMLVGAAAGMLLVYAAATNRLSTWLSQRPLQFLGTISYSLYLSHMEVINASGRLEAYLGVDRMGMAADVAWTVATIIVCIPLAYLLHVAIERPTRQLAARLKPGTPRVVTVRSTVAQGNAAAPLATAV